MPRYGRGPVAGKPVYIETPLWDDVEPHRHAPTVVEHDAVDTGLVWITGEPIMRVPNPIGFGRDEEW